MFPNRIILFLVTMILMIYPAMSQEVDGTIHIYIFSGTGLPLSGVTTTIRNVTYESDSNGFLDLSLPPGRTELTLYYNGNIISTLKVSIHSGQISEVIINASSEQKVISDEDKEKTDSTDKKDKIIMEDTNSSGTLTGKVTHIENGKPVENATIIFRGTEVETHTNEKGIFQVKLSGGTYSISIIHPDFSSQTLEAIEIKTGDITKIDIQLTPSAIQLEEIPVFASAKEQVRGGIAELIEETKNSAVVMSIIGSEQMAKMGDSDAASALRRVTGLTVIGGRFVFVRGMGERYSSSYLNGALLPSPEIDKRVVPLDLFPVSIIESMAIQKTYSPDMLGDFGGGSVMLRTVGIPHERKQSNLRMTLKASVTFNPGSTFTEALMEVPGTLDFLGFDDGQRELPEEIESIDFITEETPVGDGLTQEELEKLGELMPNTWSPEYMILPLSFGLTASIQDIIEISEQSNFGYNISLIYSNKYDSIKNQADTGYSLGGNGDYALRYDYIVDSANHEVDICFLADLMYEINKNFSIGLSSLLIRLTDNETEQYNGYYGSDAVYINVIDQQWVENMLLNETLNGRIGLQILNQADLLWRYSYSLASRNEPDHRTTRYDSTDGESDYALSDRPEGSKRIYSRVIDQVHDSSVQMNIPVFIFSKKKADFLEFGVRALYRFRETDTRKFLFTFSETNVPPDILENDPEDIFTAENIGEYFTLQETTVPSDNYRANLFVLSGFFTADILLFDKLRCNTGVRIEYGDQKVHTFDLFTTQPETVAYTTIDVLPCINFTWSLTQKLQLRLSGAKTLNRPDFHEKSNVIKDEHLGKGQYQGNPELEKADIYHADSRLEVYLSEKENISFGIFYKYFINPIETVGEPKAGSTLLYTWENTPSAFNLGAELEWKLTFSAVSDIVQKVIFPAQSESGENKDSHTGALEYITGFFRDLYTSGNIAFIWSQVDYAELSGTITNTSKQRALQGQSPYVINVSLGYENSVSWSRKTSCITSIYLNYNVFGRRLLSIGTYSVPDIFEEPFHQLDIIAKQKFSETVSLGIKIKNLPDLPARESIGGSIWSNLIGEPGKIIYEYKKGRSIELSVTLKL
ncbi:MAG: carboxypeptidase regulatory-like domain-containing protein [Spirochaetales bacterium]|nr:carboxypeptidase regulatory-like domain-containing protein [Spirochaetales bacterium]